MVEFSSVFLLKVRREAFRRRVWFRVLDSTERALLYLVRRCVETQKNARLIDVLAKIIVKIRNALKSPITTLVSQVGKSLVMGLSCIAQRWGHDAASEWTLDGKFWRYLAIESLNNILGSRPE